VRERKRERERERGSKREKKTRLFLSPKEEENNFEKRVINNKRNV